MTKPQLASQHSSPSLLEGVLSAVTLTMTKKGHFLSDSFCASQLKLRGGGGVEGAVVTEKCMPMIILIEKKGKSNAVKHQIRSNGR